MKIINLLLSKKFFRKYKQIIFILFLSITTILIFIPIFTYAYFARDLTTKESIMNRNDTGVILLDRNNKPFFNFYQAKQKNFVPLAAIPKNVQDAIIATEDEEFYSHPGFSIRGILRSIYLDFKAGERAYGGSTITQQLVKNVLLSSRKSFLRKYQEIVLAQEIERRYSKNEILEMYLNSVYFGEGAFGIENAALSYFGKSAKDLTLAESSMLAGLLPSPSALSPISGDRERAKVRQQFVLRKMVENGYITESERREAVAQTLVYDPEEDDLNTIAPHFALLVRKELVRKFGEEQISRSGFRVKTTLNITWQEYAETVVRDQVDRLSRNNVSNGAEVTINPKTGEILTLVGSKDWYNDEYGKLDIATTPRGPGSAFKPLIYAKALEDRIITPGTILQDKQMTFEGTYKPQNYDKRFRGPVLPRRALANSLNVPAVTVMQRVGVAEGLAFAKEMGITSLKDPSQYGLSLVLGTGEVKLVELTNAFGVFASKGLLHEPTSILEITDKRGKVIYTYKPEPKQVLSEEVAFLISSFLSDNRARSEVFGSALTLSRPAAVKTGTTEDYKDAITVGFTPSLVVGVWVGNNDNSAMDQIAGSLGAAPIWRSLMERFLDQTPVENFLPPYGMRKRSICQHNGLLSRVATSSAYTEYFIPGTEPQRPCSSPEIQQPSSEVSPGQPTVIDQQSPTTEPTTDEKNDNENNGRGNSNGDGRQNNDRIEIQIPPQLQ